MKKNILFYSATILLITSSLFVQAQKIKTEIIKASLIHYPIIAVPELFTTYRVTVEGQGFNINDFNIINPEEKIQLHGFKRINEQAHLNIKITMGRLRLPQTKNNTLQELMDYGSDALIDYRLPFTYEITDNRGIVIKKEVLAQNEGFYAEGQLPDELPMQSKAIDIIKSITNYTNVSLLKLNNRIQDMFDTYREDYKAEFYIIKASKTQVYDEFTKAVKDIEKGVSNPSDEAALKTAFLPSINLWKKNLSVFDVNSEEGKPHYFLCAYNLTMTYFLLDDFDSAYQYLEITEAANYTRGITPFLATDMKKHKKYKDDYLNDRKKADVNSNTIYQQDNVKSSPGSILELGKKTTTAQPEFMTKGFVIDAKGDTLFGSFIEFDKYYKTDKFIFVENGKQKKEYIFPYEDVHQISTNGLVYFPNYTTIGFRQVVYVSLSFLVTVNGDEVTFMFFKQEKDKVKYYPLYNPEDGASYATNFKKKLSNAFEKACPFVSEKALRGEYELKKKGTDPLQEVIKDFESHCGSNEYRNSTLMLDTKRVQSRYK